MTNPHWLSILIIVGNILLSGYQAVYFVVSFFLHPKEFSAKKNHRYGILISARNEESVIGELIKSIQNQDYPSELIDIFIVADNCTDQTAHVARGLGAHVYERFNKQLVGKGYALHDLIEHIQKNYGLNTYEGFFVFDADNVLTKTYIKEMNKLFDSGYNIITGYRNSKNFGDNWITSGYGIWFFRENRFINHARMVLNTTCHVSGTGYLMRTSILEKKGGWNYHLITEDMELSVDNACQGEVIGYCRKAMVYDEQPTGLMVSIKQRIRWARGFYQVLFRYSGRMIKGFAIDHIFGCYDLFSFLFFGLFGIITGVLSILCTIAAFIQNPVYGTQFLQEVGSALLFGCIFGYLLFWLQALIVTIAEWNQIHTSTFKKIFYTFTFPFFMATYIPISPISLLVKPNWTPIPHNIAISAEEVKKGR